MSETGSLRLTKPRVAVLLRRRACRWIVLGALAISLSAPSSVAAFDGGPHFDITHDALGGEGFGITAIGIAQVNSFFTDFYPEAKAIPSSGHGDELLKILTLLGDKSEAWNSSWIYAASLLHFDSNIHCPNGSVLYGAEGEYGAPKPPAFDRELFLPCHDEIVREWERLRGMVLAVASESRAAKDPLRLLTILGISLHEVQDFYAHTNWVEPCGGEGLGPNWEADGYGAIPTWFDVPENVRATKKIYTSISTYGVPAGTYLNRAHGNWASGVRVKPGSGFPLTLTPPSLSAGTNKDWPGRPCYRKAYAAAYFASRQWVRMVRSWVHNENFWAAVRGYDQGKSELDRDRAAARNFLFFTGHWYGEGGMKDGDAPAGLGWGNIPELYAITRGYFHPGKTRFRKRWENNILTAVTNYGIPPTAETIASSRPLQLSERFVQLKTRYTHAIDAADTVSKADFYSRAGIGGHSFSSGMIEGRSTFAFPPPYHAYTFIKALPKTATYPEVLWDLKVTVKTWCGSSKGYGTDDHVYLQINTHTRFELEKPHYNDFEQCDQDTYELDVDPSGSYTNPYYVRDIQFLKMHKSPDGFFGGWKLAWIHVYANGKMIYAHEANKWLKDDDRDWTAPAFKPRNPIGRSVPVCLGLWDQDSLLNGGDDHADVNPNHDRYDICGSWDPIRTRPPFERDTSGGDNYGGRRWGGLICELVSGGDCPRARIVFRLENFEFNPPVPPNLPDLVISSFTKDSFTVTNRGKGEATAFSVLLSDAGPFTFSKLGVGASETRRFDCLDRVREATVDYFNEVAEALEDNNRATFTPSTRCAPIPPPGPPDLVISSLTKTDITVTNRGGSGTGAFSVDLTNVLGTARLAFAGLGPGASERRAIFCVPGTIRVFADSQFQVTETDESNNGAELAVISCIG